MMEWLGRLLGLDRIAEAVWYRDFLRRVLATTCPQVAAAGGVAVFQMFGVPGGMQIGGMPGVMPGPSPASGNSICDPRVS